MIIPTPMNQTDGENIIIKIANIINLIAVDNILLVAFKSILFFTNVETSKLLNEIFIKKLININKNKIY